MVLVLDTCALFRISPKIQIEVLYCECRGGSGRDLGGGKFLHKEKARKNPLKEGKGRRRSGGAKLPISLKG